MITEHLGRSPDMPLPSRRERTQHDDTEEQTLALDGLVASPVDAKIGLLVAG